MENTAFDFARILPLLIPIIIIQLGLQIYALVDLYRQESVKGPKWAWVLVIIFLNLIGPIVYLVVARKEE